MAAHRGIVKADPTYPQIIFKDEEQRVHFHKLKHRMIYPNRFVSRDLLLALGIIGITRILFGVVGSWGFYNVSWNLCQYNTCIFKLP